MRLSHSVNLTQNAWLSRSTSPLSAGLPRRCACSPAKAHQWMGVMTTGILRSISQRTMGMWRWWMCCCSLAPIPATRAQTTATGELPCLDVNEQMNFLISYLGKLLGLHG
jgi:hypothetical protein